MYLLNELDASDTNNIEIVQSKSQEREFIGALNPRRQTNI